MRLEISRKIGVRKSLGFIHSLVFSQLGGLSVSELVS